MLVAVIGHGLTLLLTIAAIVMVPPERPVSDRVAEPDPETYALAESGNYSIAGTTPLMDAPT